MPRLLEALEGIELDQLVELLVNFGDLVSLLEDLLVQTRDLFGIGFLGVLDFTVDLLLEQTEVNFDRFVLEEKRRERKASREGRRETNGNDGVDNGGQLQLLIGRSTRENFAFAFLQFLPNFATLVTNVREMDKSICEKKCQGFAFRQLGLYCLVKSKFALARASS